jgi:hypothetical protein
MNRFRNMREEDLDTLLAGRAPSSDAGLEGVAGFVRSLQVVHPEEPVPDRLETAHVAALVAAAELLAETCGSVASSAARPFRRPRPVRLALKLAAASAVFVLLFCGLALAGALPDPVQDFASRAASAIGLHIAHPGAGPSTPGAGVAASPTARPSATAGQKPVVKPSPTARPAKHHAADQGQKQNGSGTQGQSGGQQQQNQAGGQPGGQQQTQPGGDSGGQNQAPAPDQSQSQDQSNSGD